MAKTRGIQWAEIANTNVGRMNAHKVADVWPTKATNAAKKSKYGNIKVVIDGNKFDSKGEGLRYEFLKYAQSLGRIKDLRLQVPYELTPKGRKKDGTAVRAVVYKADFVYINNETGEEVVEDFKGKRTQDYINKSKAMLDVHGIEIYETNRNHLKEYRL